MDIIEELLSRVESARAEILRLRQELEEKNHLLDSRAGRLLQRRQFFLVVANDEPYFRAVYDMIRGQEIREGNWTDKDQLMYHRETACLPKTNTHT